MSSQPPAIRRTICLLFCLAVVSLSGAGRQEDLSADELARRRERIANMSPAEKDQLRRNWEQFQNATPEVRAALRELEAKVRHDPQRERLEAIMKRHHEWIQDLPPATQRSLRGMEVSARVEMVKSIRRRQAASRMLAGDEMREVMRAIVEFAIERFGGDPDKAGWLRGMKGESRPRMNEWMARRLLAQMEEEQFAKVVEKLRPESRRLLFELETFDERRSQLAGWIKYTVDRRYRQYGQVPDEELRSLFLELDKYQRDRLEALPPEEMKEELTRLYRRMRPPRGNGRGPEKGGRGDRDGDRNNDGNRSPNRGDRSGGDNQSSRRSDRD